MPLYNEEINRFIQEPDSGEECPRYEYRQYMTEHGLITVAVNLCETKQGDVESQFAEKLDKILEDLERAKENETITIIDEDGGEHEL